MISRASHTTGFGSNDLISGVAWIEARGAPQVMPLWEED